jgi:hypothetical protein
MRGSLSSCFLNNDGVVVDDGGFVVVEELLVEGVIRRTNVPPVQNI